MSIISSSPCGSIVQRPQDRTDWYKQDMHLPIFRNKHAHSSDGCHFWIKNLRDELVFCPLIFTREHNILFALIRLWTKSDTLSIFILLISSITKNKIVFSRSVLLKLHSKQVRVRISYCVAVQNKVLAVSHCKKEFLKNSDLDRRLSWCPNHLCHSMSVQWVN